MKLFVFLMLASALSVHCFAQVAPADSQSKAFLNSFVSRYEKGTPLYYKPDLNPRVTDHIVASLDEQNSDSVYRDVNDQKTVFALSKEEKDQIKMIWEAQKNKVWDSTLLEHARVFREKPIPANFTRAQRLEYLAQFDGKKIIQFSRPVFLRGNTLCIFFYVSPWGEGSIFILKKENQDWVKVLRKTLYYS